MQNENWSLSLSDGIFLLIPIKRSIFFDVVAAIIGFMLLLKL